MKSRHAIRFALALITIALLLGLPDLSMGISALFSPAAVTGGLEGRWRFDEGTGTTTADLTGNGHTGTLTGGPTWSSIDPSGNPYALDFDGVDDYVTLGDPAGLDFTGVITIAAWIKATLGGIEGSASSIGSHTNASSAIASRAGNIRDGCPYGCLPVKIRYATIPAEKRSER